jgi:hypothetical protein
MIERRLEILAPGEELAVVGRNSFAMVKAARVTLDIGKRGLIEQLETSAQVVSVVHAPVEIAHRDSGRVLRATNSAEGLVSFTVVARMGP